jgi:outer membrane protein TolC
MEHSDICKIAACGLGTATTVLSLGQVSEAAVENRTSNVDPSSKAEVHVSYPVDTTTVMISGHQAVTPEAESAKPTFAKSVSSINRDNCQANNCMASSPNHSDLVAREPINASNPPAPLPETMPLWNENEEPPLSPKSMEASLPSVTQPEAVSHLLQADSPGGEPHHQAMPAKMLSPALSENPSMGDISSDPSQPGQDEPISSASQETGPSMSQYVESSREALADSSTSLVANPNPLYLPTQPDQVEITDTEQITLDEAISLGQQNSESIEIAVLELERSRESLREQEAALYPSLGVNFDLDAAESNSIATIPTPSGLRPVVLPGEVSTSLTGAVEVTYDLFTSGGRAAAITAAQAEVQVRELAIEQQQRQLRLEVAQEYYSLQGAVEQVRIGETFLREAERNLRDAWVRYEAGIGTQFDVLRADIQVANARQTVVQAQSQVETAQSRLTRQLNLPSNLNVSATPLNVSEPWSLSLEESIILAYQNRVELEQQILVKRISEQQRLVARAATRPRVSLFLGYSFQDELNRPPTAVDTLQGGVRLNWNFYDGGAARAQSRQREKDTEIAEYQFSEVRNNIRQEVEESYFSLRASLENLDSASTAVEQARQALEIANIRFNAGLSTQLDLLSSTRELTSAQANFVEAIQNYNQAFAALQRATGSIGLPDHEK